MNDVIETTERLARAIEQGRIALSDLVYQFAVASKQCTDLEKAVKEFTEKSTEENNA